MDECKPLDGGVPDVGAFYTAAKLKEVAPDSQVAKIEMFLLGNAGAPSVSDARGLARTGHLTPYNGHLIPLLWAMTPL